MSVLRQELHTTEGGWQSDGSLARAILLFHPLTSPSDRCIHLDAIKSRNVLAVGGTRDALIQPLAFTPVGGAARPLIRGRFRARELRRRRLARSTKDLEVVD
jgi:hypothetical protein